MTTRISSFYYWRAKFDFDTKEVPIMEGLFFCTLIVILSLHLNEEHVTNAYLSTEKRILELYVDKNECLEEEIN